jgi:hypothetical protein
MKKIIESNFIDFRNPLKIVSTDKYFVIQPDYQIQGQRVYIECIKGKEFKVTVGCQSLNITKLNALSIACEIEGLVKEPVTYNLILPIDNKREFKSVRNLPIYLESSDTMHISTNGKAYAKEHFAVVVRVITPLNEYFKSPSKSSFNTTTYIKNDRRLYAEETKSVKLILQTICNFFAIQYPITTNDDVNN